MEPKGDKLCGVVICSVGLKSDEIQVESLLNNQPHRVILGQSLSFTLTHLIQKEKEKPMQATLAFLEKGQNKNILGK